VSRVDQKKSRKQCRCSIFFSSICFAVQKKDKREVDLHRNFLLTSQYLERRECEYDQKISVDFFKVLSICFSL
jgi:hypothetical protein